MPREQQNQELEACWSCGKPGSIVAGKSWVRECRLCEVRWDATPASSPRARDERIRRTRQLDAIAQNYDLGNRHDLIDHATVNLSSPA